MPNAAIINQPTGATPPKTEVRTTFEKHRLPQANYHVGVLIGSAVGAAVGALPLAFGGGFQAFNLVSGALAGCFTACCSCSVNGTKTIEKTVFQREIDPISTQARVRVGRMNQMCDKATSTENTEAKLLVPD